MFIERLYYRTIGVRKEFPQLNPVSAALMKAGAKLHVAKHHCVIEIEGHPLPKEGAAILTGNHYSKYDPIIAGHAGFSMAERIIRTVVKKSLVVRGAFESEEFLSSIGDKAESADYKPVEAFTMRGIGVIPILRDNPGIDFVRKCYEVLDSGQFLGIFLQQTRDEKGLLRNLQLGVAHISSRTKYRNVPIHAFAFSENRAILIEPFTYNELREQQGKDMDSSELTIIIADKIAAKLPQRVQDDWKVRREVEFTRLSTPKKAA